MSNSWHFKSSDLKLKNDIMPHEHHKLLSFLFHRSWSLKASVNYFSNFSPLEHNAVVMIQKASNTPCSCSCVKFVLDGDKGASTL